MAAHTAERRVKNGQPLLRLLVELPDCTAGPSTPTSTAPSLATAHTRTPIRARCPSSSRLPRSPAPCCRAARRSAVCLSWSLPSRRANPRCLPPITVRTATCTCSMGGGAEPRDGPASTRAASGRGGGSGGGSGAGCGAAAGRGGDHDRQRPVRRPHRTPAAARSLPPAEGAARIRADAGRSC